MAPWQRAVPRRFCARAWLDASRMTGSAAVWRKCANSSWSRDGVGEKISRKRTTVAKVIFDSAVKPDECQLPENSSQIRRGGLPLVPVMAPGVNPEPDASATWRQAAAAGSTRNCGWPAEAREPVFPTRRQRWQLRPGDEVRPSSLAPWMAQRGSGLDSAGISGHAGDGTASEQLSDLQAVRQSLTIRQRTGRGECSHGVRAW